MPLTDTEIRKAKPLANDYQTGDGKGLSLIDRKKGTKTWRYEFRVDGKKDKYHYGNYPEISLLDARKIHDVARKLVEFGKHPATLLDAPASKPRSTSWRPKDSSAHAAKNAPISSGNASAALRRSITASANIIKLTCKLMKAGQRPMALPGADTRSPAPCSPILAFIACVATK